MRVGLYWIKTLCRSIPCRYQQYWGYLTVQPILLIISKLRGTAPCPLSLLLACWPAKNQHINTLQNRGLVFLQSHWSIVCFSLLHKFCCCLLYTHTQADTRTTTIFLNSPTKISSRHNHWYTIRCTCANTASLNSFHSTASVAISGITCPLVFYA